MKRIVVIAGPTATGKTEIAIELAKKIDGEIVSCDSMQLYKYMDIGSAKPTSEEMASVKHHLIDEVDPRKPFSVAIYRDMAKNAIFDIFERGKTPIVAGGTGLYLNSLLYDMDFSNADKNEELRASLEKEAEEFGAEHIYARLVEIDPIKAEKIHPNNVKKIIRALEGALTGSGISDFRELKERTSDYDTVLIAITRNREELYDRINKRVDIMLGQGLVEEVRSLLDMGLSESDISMKGIGYKEIIEFLSGETSLDAAAEKIKQNTRRLAKRQITWFKRYEDMKWFNISETGKEETLKEILNLINKKTSDQALCRIK